MKEDEPVNSTSWESDTIPSPKLMEDAPPTNGDGAAATHTKFETNDFETSEEKTMNGGLNDSKHAPDEGSASRKKPAPIDDGPASSLDNTSFAQWRKSLSSIGNKYRRDQPEAAPSADAVEVMDQTEDGKPHPAEVIGGWDGTASPTYLRERGLIACDSDITDEHIFSLTETFPWYVML